MYKQKILQPKVTNSHQYWSKTILNKTSKFKKNQSKTNNKLIAEFTQIANL